jgi:uncharacterized protein
MSVADVRGRFLWYELMTSDPKGAQAFYTKVCGWSLQTMEMTGGPYVMWSRGQVAVGGVMALPDDARKMGAPSHWMAYIGTPAIDQTVELATKLGARTVVPPTDIPAVGRFAALGDPQGAMFAVYTPATAPPEPAGPPQVGDFSWHELSATDHVAAFSFYHALFGWEKTGVHDMGPMGLYQMFGRKGYTLGGMFNKPKDMPVPPHWLIYIRVPDIQHAASAVTSHGGTIVNGPNEVPGGDWVVQALDPQGALFALHQRKAE